MGLSRIMDLVSQAEREGVTLAAVLSRDISIEELELIQAELASHMNENYSKIERFMASVEVPSMEDVLGRLAGALPEIDFGKLVGASDDDEADAEGT